MAYIWPIQEASCCQVKMHLFKLLTLSTMLLFSMCAKSIKCQRVLPFTGDVSLEQYLKQLCSSTSDYKIKLIVVLVQLPSNVSQTTIVSPYVDTLKRLHCDYIYHHQQFNQLNYSLLHQVVHRFQYSPTQLVLDYSQTTLDRCQLNETLHRLAALFAVCPHCQPFILITTLSQIQLYQMSSKLVVDLPQNFQSILLHSTTSQAVFIRPIVNGCHLLQSAFMPKTNSDFDSLKATKCNLQGQRLRVAVNNAFPFCSFTLKPNGQIVPQQSIEFDLLNVMARSYNFSTHLISANNSWGVKSPSGKWIGLVGIVERGVNMSTNRATDGEHSQLMQLQQADFGMCEIVRNAERMEVLHFAEFTFVDQRVFISQSPTIKKHGFLLSNKMSAEIWLCQLVAFVVMVLLLHIGRHLSSGKRPLALDRRTFTSIRTFVFQLYGLFFKQSIRAIFNETLHSNRILIAFWMLLGLVLSNVFSSIFYAILTVPEYEKAIDSVDDLLEAARTDSRFILTHDKSAMLRLIVNATANDAIDFELKQHLERVQQKMVVTMMEYIPTVEADRRNVLISLKLSIQAYRYLYATMPLHIGSETLGWAYMSWVLPKRSPLMAHFNEVIIKLREMDIFEKWKRIAIRKLALTIPTKKIQFSIRDNIDTTEQTSQQIIKTLTLDDLSSVFEIFGYGLACCCLELMCEILVDWLCNRKLIGVSKGVVDPETGEM